MFRNILKVAFRNLWKRKSYSIINITGLAIGIAACLVIILYVQNEFSFDRFHSKADRIYRVSRELNISGEQMNSAPINYAFGPLLEQNFEQVEAVVKLSRTGGLVEYEDQKLVEDKFYLADAAFTDVFDLEFVSGSAEGALDQPFTLLITEATAQKYFEEENAVGKIITFKGDKEFMVTGVVKEFPPNAHFHFDFLASMESTKNWYNPVMFEHWGNTWVYTYCLLREGTDPGTIEAGIVSMIQTYGPPVLKNFEVRFFLEPLSRIHLHSHLLEELEQNGNITFVYVFMAVAILILLIACFNFINLATARSSWRAKEVGLRKVIGARKNQLVLQFLSESLFITVISIVVALLLVWAVLPFFNNFAGRELTLDLANNGLVVLSLVLIALVVGLFSGSFPAFYLSSFQPGQVLKGHSTGNFKLAGRLRQFLVVFQFGISMVLVIGTIMIYQQMDFLKFKDLGFNKEQALVIELPNQNAREKINLLRETFGRHAQVLEVAAGSDVPPARLNSWRIRPAGTPESENELIQIIAADETYANVLDFEFTHGRNFDKAIAGDEANAILINEAAARHFYLEDPLGAEFQINANRKGKVVGVIKDFHVSSLHQEISPLFLLIHPSWYDQLILKVNTDNLTGLITYLDNEWEALVPEWPFTYHFVDEDFERQYRAEDRLSQLISYFSVLALFIAGLGLYGLASFMAEQRLKEIGIRKVLGAELGGIIWIQFRVFIMLVAISFFVAAPAAQYLVEGWLDNFAYRTAIGWWVYPLAAFGTMLVALVTVSFQSIKAALVNPVEVLRNE